MGRIREDVGEGKLNQNIFYKKIYFISIKQNKTKNCTGIPIYSYSHTDANYSIEGKTEGLTVGLWSAYTENLGRYVWKF